MPSYEKNQQYYQSKPDKFKYSYCPKCSDTTYQKILNHVEGKCEKCGSKVK